MPNRTRERDPGLDDGASVEPVRSVGIGPVLRKARLLRGKSIEEASRETRMRPDYLQALEREHFDELLGDVYVRGFLRSYATYLGLDPDKVLSVYNRRFGPHAPTLPEAAPAPARQPKSPHPHLPAVVRRHPSWMFLMTVALLMLGVLASVGLLSRTPPDPRATAPPTPEASSIPVLPPEVSVGLRALKRVEIIVTVDGGQEQAYVMRRDEVRSFVGAAEIHVVMDRGGRARLTVNGHRLGAPGNPSFPYIRSFGPEDFRETPSPSGD